MAVSVAAGDFLGIASNDVAQEYGVKRLFITSEGNERFEQNPLALETFLESAQHLTSHEIRPNSDKFTYINRGNFGFVYELPGFEDLCFKVVTSRTLRSAKYHPDLALHLPSLITESRLMNEVQRRLALRPEHHVNAPKQYAAIRFAGGCAMLQERVPGQFRPLRKVLDGMEDAGVSIAEVVEHEEIATERVKKALGTTILKAGIGDLRGQSGRLNGGNVLVNQTDNLAESDMYVIDLMGAWPTSRPYCCNHNYMTRLASILDCH